MLTTAGREAVAAADEIDQVTAALDGRIASVSDAQPRGTVRFTAPQWIAARFTTHGGAIAFRANDPEALLSAASAGLGLAAAPCLLGDAQPALQRVETLGVGRCDMFLICPEELRQSPRVRAVSDFVAELLVRHRHEMDPFGKPDKKS